MPHRDSKIQLSNIKMNIKQLGKFIGVLFLMVTLAMPVSLYDAKPVKAVSEIDKINQQIEGINKSIGDNLAKKQTAESELATIDSQVEVIRLQVNSTQLQLDQANEQIATLTAKITESEDNITKQKTLLGEYVRQMYIDGQVSQVQLVLTAKNFSDFVDRSEYLNTMQAKVTDTVKKIVALKDELTKQKNEVEITKANAESLLASQTAQKNALASQQAYRNSVIAGVNASNNDLASQKDALYQKKARLSVAYGETILNGSSDYPWGSPVPRSLSCNYGTCTEDGMGYYIGQCTSYVAWKRRKIGKPIPPAIGNGGEWTGGAAGYPQSYTPQSGDAMIFPNLGSYGHVAFVDSVNGDGTVNISEYNWTPDSFTMRTVNPYSYGAYFIH